MQRPGLPLISLSIMTSICREYRTACYTCSLLVFRQRHTVTSTRLQSFFRDLVSLSLPGAAAQAADVGPSVQQLMLEHAARAVLLGQGMPSCDRCSFIMNTDWLSLATLLMDPREWPTA